MLDQPQGLVFLRRSKRRDDAFLDGFNETDLAIPKPVAAHLNQNIWHTPPFVGISLKFMALARSSRASRYHRDRNKQLASLKFWRPLREERVSPFAKIGGPAAGRDRAAFVLHLRLKAAL